MHQTKKGNQWYFGMKAHIGVDAGTGYIHSVTCTAANVHDLDEAVNLVRADDEVVYTDAGYQGAEKRPEIAGDEHLSRVEWRVAARKGVLKAMAEPDRAAQSRQASVRAKVEHPSRQSPGKGVVYEVARDRALPDHLPRVAYAEAVAASAAECAEVEHATLLRP